MTIVSGNLALSEGETPRDHVIREFVEGLRIFLNAEDELRNCKEHALNHKREFSRNIRIFRNQAEEYGITVLEIIDLLWPSRPTSVEDQFELDLGEDPDHSHVILQFSRLAKGIELPTLGRSHDPHAFLEDEGFDGCTATVVDEIVGNPAIHIVSKPSSAGMTGGNLPNGVGRCPFTGRFFSLSA